MKNLFSLLLLLSCAQILSAQVYPPYRIQVNGTQSGGTTICAGTTVNISGIARFEYNAGSTGPYYTCPLSRCYVYIERWTGSSWTQVASTITAVNNPNYSINFSPSSGSHRIFSTVHTQGNYCTGWASEYFTTLTSYTVNTPASSSFRVNNGVVNPTTYKEVCDAGAINLTNISMAGTNTNYEWRVGASRSGGAPLYRPWVSGNNLFQFDFKDFLQTYFAAFPLAADYDVYMQTRNLCNAGNPHSYMGKLRILTSNINIVLQAKNTPSGTPLSTISTSTTCASPHTALCYYSAIIAANQSTVPVLIGGQWSCRLDEIPVGNCAATPVLVFSKPSAPLYNLNDLASLDLNAFATIHGGKPGGYLVINANTKIWKFTLTISNSCNAGTSAVCYLRNINFGCKTDGEGNELATTDNQTLSLEKDWTFYPNPAKDRVSIMWNDFGQKADIRLFDMMGKQIVVPTTVGGQEATIDVSGLAKGNYILMLNGSGYEPRVLMVE